MAKQWQELCRKSEDAEAGMGDVDGNESGMCEEVSWEEVVEVMKCLKRGKAAGPDKIIKEMLIYMVGQ